jgi:hypothetical protein
MRGRIAIRTIAVSTLLVGCGNGVDESRLVVETHTGSHVFVVEVADDDAERRTGLMYRESLADNAGMIFDFKEDAPQSMWMKNTLIPLDMAFIDGSGRIVEIAAMTTPRSLTPVRSGAPARAVLEVAGGRLAAIGAKPGDRVEHPIFSTTED